MQIEIITDGGSENNQSAVHRWGYGSYLITSDEQPGQVLREAHRLQFGSVTNNEAEYLALINALCVVGSIKGQSPVTAVHISSDSLLMINQIVGRWEAISSNLQVYLQYVRDVLNAMKKGGIQITFTHMPRERIAAILGH